MSGQEVGIVTPQPLQMFGHSVNINPILDWTGEDYREERSQKGLLLEAT